MTDPTAPANVATLDARRQSAHFEISDDGLTYTCTRTFGAAPDRVYTAFTDPADLRVWFPAGAPPGSEMPVCESDAVESGKYHYVMVVPEFGQMSWHGTYTGVDRPVRIDADEWFVMGEGEPDGPATSQTLTFAPTGGGFTFMTMTVHLPEPEDPETFMEQSAAGLGSSLAAMDELVSS